MACLLRSSACDQVLLTSSTTPQRVQASFFNNVFDSFGFRIAWAGGRRAPAVRGAGARPFTRSPRVRILAVIPREVEVRLPALSAVTSESTFQKLALLLRRNLDFGSHDSAYASHAIHPFSAKFPPQIPRLFIEELTESGDSILDPMAGSGTAIVEALILRREAFGFDIDPLAVRLCTVKTKWLNPTELEKAGIEIIQGANRILGVKAQLRKDLENRFDTETKKFIDYWFLPETQLELLALIRTIQDSTEYPFRDFFELVFSSAIIAKTGGVSLARDLAHSRPHRDEKKKPRNAILEFQLRLAKTLKRFQNLPQGIKRVIIGQRTAKELPLPSNSIDLVITSPPYANAIDYMRAHKFSLVWFGHPIGTLSELRGRYIGSERRADSSSDTLPPRTETAVKQLEQRDSDKARIVSKYLSEMEEVLTEMHRVLRVGKPAIIVVGPSLMRGFEVRTHDYLAEIGESIGFRVAGIQKRQIARDRRMLPVSFGRNGDSMIEQRIHEEFVVGLVKNP